MQLSYETLLDFCANGGAMHKLQQGPHRPRLFPAPVAALLQQDVIGSYAVSKAHKLKLGMHSSRRASVMGPKCRRGSDPRAGGSFTSKWVARRRRWAISKHACAETDDRCAHTSSGCRACSWRGTAAGGLWGSDLINVLQIPRAGSVGARVPGCALYQG